MSRPWRGEKRLVWASALWSQVGASPTPYLTDGDAKFRGGHWG